MSLLLEILGPRQNFEGGLFLPDYKAGTAKRPTETLAVQETLRIPLTVRKDLQTTCIVKIGEHVRRGQLLATPIGPEALPVHAPTSGEITEFSRTWTPLDGFLPCVVLQPDGRDEWFEFPARWEDGAFTHEIRNAGVMCPNPREPLHVLLNKATHAGVSDLIINAMETEPYLTADLRTLVEEPGRMIDATGEIADALGVYHVHFALPYRHRRVTKRIEAEARGRYIDVIPLAHKYPQCNPIVLLKTLLDREVSPGGSPLDEAAIVLPLAVVRMAAQALLEARPITHAVMTVAGDAIERPGTYRVAVGTPIADLVRRVGLIVPPEQAIWGGPLSGIPLQRQDGVVTADCPAILMFQIAPQAQPVPCVRCGWCVEDCPVGLDPSALMHLEAEERCEGTELTLLRACVDCGLCSHVCPSQLPLAQSIWRSRHRFGHD